MLLKIVLLLILSQVALRTGDFELCNRPSKSALKNLDPLRHHPWPGGMREAIK